MKAATLLLTWASTATAMCHYGTSFHPRSTDLAKRASGHFGYHELLGPLNWHGIDPEANGVCANGTHQSPINIISGEETTISGSSYNLHVDSYPHGAELENLGTTVQGFVNGSATVLDDDAYSLVQFHFHTPSEHHVNGEHFPAEIHFVFQNSDKKIAVIGFVIDIATDCKSSTLLEAILAKLGDIELEGQTTHTDPLDFSSLESVLKSSDVFQYGGSLTTPPCSEGVTFNVAEKPLYLSARTYKKLRGIIKFNSRYTQNKPGQKNLLQLP